METADLGKRCLLLH